MVQLERIAMCVRKELLEYIPIARSHSVLKVKPKM